MDNVDTSEAFAILELSVLMIHDWPWLVRTLSIQVGAARHLAPARASRPDAACLCSDASILEGAYCTNAKGAENQKHLEDKQHRR